MSSFVQIQSQLSLVLVQLVRTALYDSSVEPALALVDTEAKGLDSRLRGLIEQVGNLTCLK